MKHYRFSNLDYIIYDDQVLTNFIHNIELIGQNNLEFVDYLITDSDTPEIICYKLYGDSSLSWILLWLNNIVDSFYDWPLNDKEFYNYVTNKYGNLLYLPHHYEKNGYIVNQSPTANIVTNYDYEFNLNNAKRKIKLPTPETMNIFINAI